MSSLLAFLRALTGLIEALTPLVKEMVHEKVRQRRQNGFMVALQSGDADALAAQWDMHDGVLSDSGAAVAPVGEDGDSEESGRHLDGIEWLDGTKGAVRESPPEPMP